MLVNAGVHNCSFDKPGILVEIQVNPERTIYNFKFRDHKTKKLLGISYWQKANFYLLFFPTHCVVLIFDIERLFGKHQRSKVSIITANSFTQKYFQR